MSDFLFIMQICISNLVHLTSVCLTLPTKPNHAAKGDLYIIDVSQSVDLDHPKALDFLREDCKHVNDFFRRNGEGVQPAGGPDLGNLHIMADNRNALSPHLKGTCLRVIWSITVRHHFLPHLAVQVLPF